MRLQPIYRLVFTMFPSFITNLTVAKDTDVRKRIAVDRYQIRKLSDLD
jgi:hypothetical protein